MSLIIFSLEFGSVFTIKTIINFFQGDKFYDIPLIYLGIAFLTFKIISIFISRQNQIIQVSQIDFLINRYNMF